MRLFVAAALLASSSAFAFGLLGSSEKGNGKIASRSFDDLGAFTGVSVGHGVQATISQGDKTSVTLEGDENIIALFKAEVTSKGWLKVTTDGRSFNTRTPIRLKVVTRTLEKVSASGGASADAELVSGDEVTLDASGGGRVKARVSANHARLDASGGGEITVSGASRTMDVDVSGGAELHAFDFSSESVAVDASGGAFAEVQALRALNVDSSGGATVKVSGNPQRRNIDSSSGARVTFVGG